MKTLGIIGGLGPESTIDYYRSLISLYREETSGSGYPPLIIVSLDVDKGLRLLGENQLEEMAEYLAGATRQLAAAGADFALLSANSGHIVFDQLRRASPIPLISIVEVTCEAVTQQQLKTVGLLGTRFTMAGRFYFDIAEKYGLRLIAPTADEQAYIHDKYVNELLLGKFLPETRERLTQIITTMKQRDAIEGIVLAGTELPLILRADSIAGMPLFDTTQIHVRAAVAEMLGGEKDVRAGLVT
jgi:aspartate racemase